MKSKLIILICSFMYIGFNSCDYDNEEELFGTPEPIEMEVSFSTDILPIVQSKCAIPGCHVAGAQSPNFEDNSTILGRADRIKARTSSGTMPPSNVTGLTITEINLISAWVDAGAPNN